MKMFNTTAQPTQDSGTEMPDTSRRLGDRIRHMRMEQRLSLRTLAERSGFSPSFISQIENGQTSPSIASLDRIAEVFGVTIGELFERPYAGPLVVRRDERADSHSTWSLARLETMASRGPNSQLDAMMVALAPGGTSGVRPQVARSETIAVVFEGSVLLTLDQHAHLLHRGDAATLPPNLPYHWRNDGEDDADILVVTSCFPGFGVER